MALGPHPQRQPHRASRSAAAEGSRSRRLDSPLDFARDDQRGKKTMGWADWVEPDFPFFSSVLDARRAGPGPANNLTPRGLMMNLGRGYWVGFDTDLLRVAAT
jgi:hypothetical protein